jgi:DNA-3-methyladenine glycosylase II
MTEETFWLDPLLPFRLDLTVWALRRRASNQIDQWDGATYTRVLVLDGQPVKVTVSQPRAAAPARLLVTAASRFPLARLGVRINCLLQQMLGCATDVSAFADLARRDPTISDLARRFQGLKPPRFPTLFEALLNAFACQQVSLDVGLLLLNRLTQRYGLAWEDEQGTRAAFPGPERLAGASEAQLRTLGWSRQKARAALDLASLLTRNPAHFAHLETLSNEEVCQALQSLRGVGRWSAEYVLLRGLGRIDTFPGDDVGAQNNLKRLLALDEKLTYARINALTARWQPYAGFVYFHLLLRTLDQKGLLPGTGGSVQAFPGHAG